MNEKLLFLMLIIFSLLDICNKWLVLFINNNNKYIIILHY